jgi:cytosine deaminase
VNWPSVSPVPGTSTGPYGPQAGDRADLVVVGAPTPAEAVVTHPTHRLVLKDGAVVARDGQLV